MQVLSSPPTMNVPNVEKPFKMSHQVGLCTSTVPIETCFDLRSSSQTSPVSAKKVSPLQPKSEYRLPATSEHVSRDSLSAKKHNSTNLPSSTEIRQRFSSKYQLGRILGRGASAEVYEARLLSSSDESFPLAVKIIRRDNRMNDSLTMATELEILRRVQHSNVIGLVEVYETLDTLYLVMERAQGGDLLSALASMPVYTESAVRDIFRQLLEAVDYLHGLGVVHRDLKLDNLLYNTENSTASYSDDETDDDSVSSQSRPLPVQSISVKVADFGLSALLSEDKPKSMSLFSSPAQQAKNDKRLKDLWGTTEYFAPEVYDRHYGRQADVWALGCILFEMLTGELAFPYRETPLGIVERVLFHGGGKPLRVFERKQGWSKLSKDAQSLIKKMLKTSPTKRYNIAECLQHPWFNSSSPRPVNLKHVSSADSVRSCATCATSSSASNETPLTDAQQILKERVSRRERRYQNLLLEVAMRNKDRK